MASDGPWNPRPKRDGIASPNTITKPQARKRCAILMRRAAKTKMLKRFLYQNFVLIMANACILLCGCTPILSEMKPTNTAPVAEFVFLFPTSHAPVFYHL